MWTVYYHQNKINGKIYVGITSIQPEQRWGKDGHKYSHSPHFCAALNKYGWDNFDHVIFASNLTKEEAENMEMILIEKFQLQDPKYGYNVENGGSVKLGVKHDSDMHHELMRFKFVAVECIEDGMQFECIMDAARFYGLAPATIRKSCRRYDEGKQYSHTGKGRHFKHITHIKA